MRKLSLAFAMGVAAAGLVAGEVTARATTIASDTSGTLSSPTNFQGLVITTPTGGPWDNLALNFYRGTTPVAAGDVFLLTMEYLGTPSGLSSSTPGFLAESTGISGGVYDFAPGVTILGGTTYWFYTDASLAITGGNSGTSYFATSAGSDFLKQSAENNYLLSGNLATAATPLPAALPLFASGLGALGLLGWRRKRKAQAA